jgi:hypothetical protein
MRLGLVVVSVALAAAGAFVGCATASEDFDVVPSGGDFDSGHAVDSGRGDSTAPSDADEPDGYVTSDGSMTRDSGPASDADVDTGGSDTGAADTGAADSGDTGAADSDVDTGPVDSGPVACIQVTAADCSSAQDLGTVSGDTGAGLKMAEGTNGKFLKIRVTEDDHGLFATELWTKFTLTSTARNFDMYIYPSGRLGDGGASQCTSVCSACTSTKPLGTTDSISLRWSDTRSNDDTTIFNIEVRPTETSCEGGSWKLVVEGNKL